MTNSASVFDFPMPPHVLALLNKHGINPLSHVDVFAEAFTHISLSQETNYERLELIGDAVASLAVRQWLAITYPDANPGSMSIMASRIVSRPKLAERGRKLGLDRAVMYSRSNPLDMSDRILCDLTEALIGAIFRVMGDDWGRTRSAVLDVVDIEHQSQSLSFRHPVNTLQEYTQARQMGVPSYSFLEMDGHQIAYKCTVSLQDGFRVISAKQRNKQLAKRSAAEKALKKLGIKETLHV